MGTQKRKRHLSKNFRVVGKEKELIQTEDIQVQKAQGKRENIMFKELKQFNMAREQREGAVVREQAIGQQGLAKSACAKYATLEVWSLS